MICTFYSFKGGVGRSMALANVAEFLCRRGLKVLMVDFDLEAPGLERYFQIDDVKVLKPEVIETRRGLIDLLISYKNLRSISSNLPISNLKIEEPSRGDSSFQTSGAEQNINTSELSASASLNQITSDASTSSAEKSEKKEQSNGNNKFNFPIEPLANFIVPIYESTGGSGSLHLMPAGRRALTLDGDDIKKKDELSKKELARYSERVRSFAWEDFYTKLDGELFFEWFRTETNKIADIVLIDSRTGFTEMSGVCTYDLPDVVVMFVAGNEQNLEGTVKIAETLLNRELIEKGRKGRELELLFVPSRVEINEKDKVDDFGKRFNAALGDFYSNAVKFDDSPFNELSVPYVPYYAFEEDVATRDPDSTIALLLVKPLEKLCHTLSQLDTDKDSNFRALFTPEQIALAKNAELTNKLAEQSFSLLPEETQRKALCVLDRFVQVEPLNDAKYDIAINVNLNDFHEEDKKLVSLLKTRRLITIEKPESSKSEKIEPDKELIAGLADKTYPQNWKRLKKWLDENREFLLWRQQLKTFIEYWKQSGERSDALLTSSQLQTALKWQMEREDGLNDTERHYLQQSSRHKADRRLATILGIVLMFVVAGSIAFYTWRQSEYEMQMREAAIEQEKEIKAQEFYTQANLSAQSEDYSSAIVLYSSAIELRPQNGKYYADRGLAYFRTPEYENAKADLLKAIELNSNDYLTYSNLGEAYYHLAVLDSAVEVLNKAIELNPGHAYSYFVRGSSHRDLGIKNANESEMNKAIDDYNMAIKLRPDFAAAYLERGWTYENLNKTEKAISDFQKAIEITNIPSIASEAREFLQRSTRTKSVSLLPKLAPATPIVYCQYAEQKNTDLIKEISDNLRNSFNVQSVEFKKELTDTGINYFYAEDKQNAEAVKNVVEKNLMAMGITLSLNLIIQNRLYKETEHGRIEVRLPSINQSLQPLNIKPAQAR